MTKEQLIDLSSRYWNKKVLIKTNKKTEKGIMQGIFVEEKSIVIDKGTYTLGIPMKDIIEITLLDE